MENKINESSLSRIWQHIQSDKNFAVISAYSNKLSDEENEEKHEQLRSELKKKHGFIEQKSGYSYFNDTKENTVVNEKSFFIPKITKQESIDLGKKYNQETIIFKDKNEFSLIIPDTGEVVKSFNKDPNKSITFDKETVRDAYSQLVKSKNKNNITPFAFTLKEIRIPTWIDVYKAKAEKTGQPHVTYIDVL